ncbi:hypothetical protein [Halobacteriovorax sp. ZH2_bin.1]|uniref:hypothetical protein n=1 Tax=unclassified Halobacteriovorax TaxID=2639665 RepID=UPI0037210873
MIGIQLPPPEPKVFEAFLKLHTIDKLMLLFFGVGMTFVFLVWFFCLCELSKKISRKLFN